MKVYAIVYGNYYPREVQSLWMTEEVANKKVETLIDEVDWRVIPMTVHETIEEVKDD